MKTLITILITASVMAFFTNPSTDRHREQALSEIMKSKNIERTQLSSLEVILSSSLTEKTVLVDNYFLFSVSRISIGGQSKTFAVGLFGYLYLPARKQWKNVIFS